MKQRMEYTRLMKERIRRVTVLFHELGYQLDEDPENNHETYTAAFNNADGFDGVIFIDCDCRFLEITHAFFFSTELTEFLQMHITFIQDICYEFGCYFAIRSDGENIVLRLHSKLYYAGLNYFSLSETLRDLSSAVQTLEEQIAIIFDPDLEEGDYECS